MKTQSIECTIWENADHYTGTRDALVATGAAKPEWFAEVGTRWKGTKRTKRSFYGLEGGRVTLCDRGDGTFRLVIKVSEAESTQRLVEQWLFVAGGGRLFTGKCPAKAAMRAARTDSAYQRFLKEELRVDVSNAPWVMEDTDR